MPKKGVNSFRGKSFKKTITSFLERQDKTSFCAASKSKYAKGLLKLRWASISQPKADSIR